MALAAAREPGDDSWLSTHAGADIDTLEGRDFERCLGAMFSRLGFAVAYTDHYDSGADLIISRNGIRTAVQAKRWDSKVGDRAVQAVAAARPFYACQEAMVVTNSEYQGRTRRLASANRVTLWDRAKLQESLLATKMLVVPLDMGPTPECDRCHVQLLLRSGPFGNFWGCPNYPRCHFKEQVRERLLLASPQAVESFHGSTAPLSLARPVMSVKTTDVESIEPANLAEPPVTPTASEPRAAPGQNRPWTIGQGVAFAALALGWWCLLAIVGSLLLNPGVVARQPGNYLYAFLLFGAPTIWGTIALRRARRSPRA